MIPLEYSTTTVTPGRMQTVLDAAGLSVRTDTPSGELRGMLYDYLVHDGVEGFVMIQSGAVESGAAFTPEIHVVLNFFELLRERVPIN
jgi:hypothetical protein